MEPDPRAVEVARLVDVMADALSHEDTMTISDMMSAVFTLMANLIVVCRDLGADPMTFVPHLDRLRAECFKGSASTLVN